MPPKRNLADSMQEVTEALKSRNNDYQQLYEAPTNDEPNIADIIRERDEKAKKRRKLINNSTVLHVGPKFRDQHVTKFRATNASVIESEGRQEGSLYEYVVDDISSDTIRAYNDCDIMLTDYIHPESPKMISMMVQDMNPDGDVDPMIARIPVPLYICLTPMQMADVSIQHGIDVDLNAFDTDSIMNLPFNLIPCNRGSGYRHHRVGHIKSCKVETFVNEVIGRMDRMVTKNSGQWDKNEKYFQAIEFKFRVAPRNSVTVKSLRNIQRGQGIQNAEKEMNQAQRDQYRDKGDMSKQYPDQDDQFESDFNSKDQTARDKALDEIGEDGTSHAAMLEWKFEMTTHVLMSPQLQAAFHQVAGILEKDLRTHGDLEPYLSNQGKRSHLANLIEYEMLEGETSLRVYTDPRAQEVAQRRRMYSIYCLRNNSR